MTLHAAQLAGVSVTAQFAVIIEIASQHTVHDQQYAVHYEQQPIHLTMLDFFL
jgi:hypothetical protein